MWRIIREALGGASPAVRRLMWRILALWIFMLALQAWDSRNASGAPGLAEALSVGLGVCGAAMLGLAYSLHLAMDEAAARAAPDARGPGVERVLLALPLVGFIAGVMVASAAVLMVVRGSLGAPWPLAVTGALVYGGLFVFAARVITGASTTLFAFASAQAEAAASAHADATAARLDALQARLNPHMLFNALNTVASLVRADPAAAERVVEDLSDVLRRGLDRSTETQSAVAAEVDYVRAWLAVEQARWGPALRLDWNVDPSTASALLPPFTLQPLVENALVHGVGARLDGGSIGIVVARDGADLVASVSDTGPGFAPGWREDTGLRVLRQRLDTLYGARASLTIDSTSRGARVTVRVPAE